MPQSLLPQEKWILLGIPVLFIVGSMFHFLYEFSGNNPLVGLISPVNESIWEHTKMVVIPLILWWTLFYLTQGKNLSIDIDSWFTGLLVSLVTSILLIPALYYFYTGAFGVSLLWVDILILLIALTIGQLLGLHVYRYSDGINHNLVILIIGAILLFYFFATVSPPEIPLFESH